MESLLDKVKLSKHVAVAVASAMPTSPTTMLMHVRFLESEVAETLPQAAPNRAAQHAAACSWQVEPDGYDPSTDRQDRAGHKNRFLGW